MTQSTLSTQEVATMLSVAETTVKRWADDATLPCVRTPGGHRKFLLRDIVRFAESNGYTIGGAQPPAMTGKQTERLELGILRRDYGLLAEVFRETALRADREGILALLLYLYKQQYSLQLILDQIIRPAFAGIGDMWQGAKLEVGQEHAATQATMEALVRMTPELHRKDPNGMSAVCACLEGELHELGVRGLAYSLEVEGWKVYYLGANTPLEALATFIQTVHPNLVCLSMTMAKNRKELFSMLHWFTEDVHAHGGRIIAGGHSAAKLREQYITCDYFAESTQDAVAYARDAFGLKPGPKKKTEAAKEARPDTGGTVRA